MENRQELTQKFWRVFPTIVSFIISLSGIVFLVEMINNPSEKSSSIVFGLSASRLLLAGLLLFIMLMHLLFGILLLKRESKKWKYLLNKIYSNYNTIFDILLVGAFGFTWLAFLGSHDFGSNQAYYLHLKPLLAYLAMVCLLWLSLGILNNYRFKKLNSGEKPYVLWFVGPITIFGIFIITWIIINLTGIGITPKFVYWSNSGTLLFGYQVVVGVILAAATTIFFSKFRNFGKRLSTKRKNLFVFIIIWGIAAILLIQTEPAHNFFAPTTGGEIYYPYSDAALYDTSAQSILIGEGFFYRNYTLRPIYITFLAVLHLISNQNYIILSSLQAGILAIFVPFLYLIGKRLHGNFLGVFLASIGTILEINAITSPTTIRVTHSKLLMTENPTMVLLIIVAYYVIVWYQEPKRRNNLFFVVFGLLTLSMLIRMHTLIALLGFLLLLFGYGRMLITRQNFKNLLIICAFVFLIIFPWMLRNYIAVGSFSIDPGRIDMLFKDRWYSNQTTNAFQLHDLHDQNETINLMAKTASLEWTSPDKKNEIVGFVEEFVSHFLHNEVLSVLALPSSYQVLDPQDYYDSSYFLYADWYGNLRLGDKLFLGINLFFLSTGIFYSYRRNGIVGLVPLFIHILYNSSDALVHTSGWRYIKPFEWTTLFYFSFGISVLIGMARNLFQNKLKSSNALTNKQIRDRLSLKWSDIVTKGGAFILITCLMAFGPLIVPQRYSSSEKLIEDKNIFNFFSQDSSFNSKDLEEFLTEPGSIITGGRLLYPRYFPSGSRIHHKPSLPFYQLDIDRVEFVLLNEDIVDVYLPASREPKEIIHASDVIVLGCEREKLGKSFIEAIGIITFDREGHMIISRTSSDDLFCKP
ncbi:MAG: hypothetical protein ABFS17_05045 [Chloroflexota bacterium]